MAESSRQIFDRCCRLCAEQQEATIMLFSDQAEALLLKNKLKYLLFQIDENDDLPKHICINCCSKLQMVCDFIESTLRAQEVLTARSKTINLHEIPSLSKKFDADNIKEELFEFDDDVQVTQMEISIDPMMVLANSNFPSPNEEEETCDDVAYLNECEDVTIKLIRKGNGDPQAEISVVEPLSDAKAKPFPCLICRRGFMTEMALKNHAWVHSKDGPGSTTMEPFNCLICDKALNDRLDLVAHMKSHRLKGTCTICGRVFRSEDNLALHLDSHNSPNNAYVCKICGRSYDKISNLKTHSVAHSTARPFQCHLCKSTFKRNQDLKFHVNQHMGIKPYKCPFCDKRFASSGNCYSHRSRMHPGLKTERIRQWKQIKKKTLEPLAPKMEIKAQVMNGIVFKYECNLCNHSFVKRDNYAYHMYQHTGKKPFQCHLCPEQFVTRKGVYLHYDREHPAAKKPLGLISKNALLN